MLDDNNIKNNDAYYDYILTKLQENLEKKPKHKGVVDINQEILTMPDTPEPTSYFLTKNFYINAINIIEKLEKLIGKDLSLAKKDIKPSRNHDVPGDWFKGPF